MRSVRRQDAGIRSGWAQIGFERGAKYWTREGNLAKSAHCTGRDLVIPAKAGIQCLLAKRHWVPAEACPRMLESGAGTTRAGMDRPRSLRRIRAHRLQVR